MALDPAPGATTPSPSLIPLNVLEDEKQEEQDKAISCPEASQKDRANVSEVRLEPILHHKFTEPVQSIQAMIADVADPGTLCETVRRVTRLLPDPSLKHLKKIRRTHDGLCQVLLGRYELVQQNMSKFQCLPIQNMKSCEIPSRPPLTRSQFEQCKLLWPTSFHEEKYVSSCLQGKRFSCQERLSIRRLVDHLIGLRNKAGAGVTVIASEDGTVLASESDDPDSHPLHHSTMLAVETIARTRVQEADGGRGYVCTGLDAFLGQECCLMCAMALLHSRIRRVFILASSTPSSCPPDKPFTRMQLHVNEKLNHGFEAWTVEAES